MLSIDSIEVDTDPEYVKASAKLNAVDGLNVVDLDIEVIKEDKDVAFQAAVYRFNVDHYEHYYKSPLESGCNHKDLKDPMLNFLFKESVKYGNLTEACPLKIGHYQVRGFKVDTADMPQQLPAGMYRFEFSAFIQKAGSFHDIYTDKYYLTV